MPDRNVLYEFAKELYLDEKKLGNKSTRDKSLIRLPDSPAIMASEIPIIIVPENPNELCDRLKVLLQEKQSGIKSNIFNEKIVAIVVKLLEYECISEKQHRFSLLSDLNYIKTMKQAV